MPFRSLRFAVLAFLCSRRHGERQTPHDPGRPVGHGARRRARSLSPDGRWVVFTVTRFSVEENKGNSDLWLVPADGSAPPRRLTWNEGADGSPAWSPDGQRIAFVSKRGDAPAAAPHPARERGRGPAGHQAARRRPVPQVVP